MRDIVFLVADSTIQQTLEGFFSRDGFHRSLGCARFAVDPRGVVKPPRPKEALEYMNRAYRTDISPAVRRRAAERISVRGCQDPAFRQFRDQLRQWFPADSQDR